MELQPPPPHDVKALHNCTLNANRGYMLSDHLAVGGGGGGG